MSKLFEVVPPSPSGRRFFRLAIVGIVLVLLLAGNPVAVIPAGHVGVKDFFGRVSSDVLGPGVRVVFPFTRVVKMSIKTQEVKETAEVPSKEGLLMDLEGSLLFRLDPEKADDIYRTIGKNYQEIAVEPQIRSAIREITASYEAKVLYSAERERIAKETLELFRKTAEAAASSPRLSCYGRWGSRRSSPTRSRRSFGGSRNPNR